MDENKFKFGDKVRCIDNEMCDHRLILNKVYTIQSFDRFGCIVLIGMSNIGWDKHRFESPHIKEFTDKLNKLID